MCMYHQQDSPLAQCLGVYNKQVSSMCAAMPYRRSVRVLQKYAAVLLCFVSKCKRCQACQTPLLRHTLSRVLVQGASVVLG